MCPQKYSTLLYWKMVSGLSVTKGLVSCKTGIPVPSGQQKKIGRVTGGCILFVLVVIIAFAVVTISVSMAEDKNVGTHGAAAPWQKWTIISGKTGETIWAKFILVNDGMVSLKLKNGKTLVLALGKFSIPDRHWIEARNPEECCLTKKSRPGTVGTLSPSHGSYMVNKLIDGETAIIDYIVDKEVKWTFCLKSKWVKSLQYGVSYNRIPPVAPLLQKRNHSVVNRAQDFVKNENGQKDIDGTKYDFIEDAH